MTRYVFDSKMQDALHSVLFKKYRIDEGIERTTPEVLQLLTQSLYTRYFDLMINEPAFAIEPSHEQILALGYSSAVTSSLTEALLLLADRNKTFSVDRTSVLLGKLIELTPPIIDDLLRNGGTSIGQQYKVALKTIQKDLKSLSLDEQRAVADSIQSR